MSIGIVLDRVGAVYAAGEHVTGVVVIDGESSGISHRGIELSVEGNVLIEPTERSGPVFKACPVPLRSQQVLSLSINLVPAGKLPPGETSIPFSFPLQSTNAAFRRLPETYHGVYVKVEYHVNATIAFMFSSKDADSIPLLVYTPGQAEPSASEALQDQGSVFSLSSANVRLSRKVNSGILPQFEVTGHVERFYNDIDTPLSGAVRITECNTPITSVEIQLIRSESIQVDGVTGKENTEVQNIQIGDGDVPRNVIIPMHMMFPKWYTCAALMTDRVKIEFEVNLVVTLEGHTQITQNLPIRLYRAPN